MNGKRRINTEKRGSRGVKEYRMRNRKWRKEERCRTIVEEEI
jgi:hypothetical protein